MVRTIIHTLPYRPRKQFLAFPQRQRLDSVLVCHRGCGKTRAAINELIKRALSHPDPKGSKFAYIAPYLKQAKAVAWKYLCDDCSPILALGAKINETELRIDLPNGAEIRLFGVDNADSLRGNHFCGVVLDEYADMDPDVRSKIIFPALTQNNGWQVIIGTPKGHNNFYEVWREAQANPAWFTMMLKASETGLIPEEKLAQARGPGGMLPEEYEQEMECSFEAAIKGAYYAAELARADSEGRIGRVPVDRALRVHTAWDLGFSDPTCVWFIQHLGKEIRLIDYYEATTADFQHFARIFDEKAYLYGTHYFPHDVAARFMGMQHSRLEILHGLGIEATYNPKPPDVADGINNVRHLLDSCWIDSERCARGLDCLKAYARDWDDKLKTWRVKPLHNYASHAADALRTFAEQWDGGDDRPRIRIQRGGRPGSWMGA